MYGGAPWEKKKSKNIYVHCTLYILFVHKKGDVKCEMQTYVKSGNRKLLDKMMKYVTRLHLMK